MTCFPRFSLLIRLLPGLLILTACHPEIPKTPAASLRNSAPTLTDQIEQVREGRSDRLVLQDTQLTEVPWTQAADWPHLRRVEITFTQSPPASLDFLELVAGVAGVTGVTQLHLLNLPSGLLLPPGLRERLELLRIEGEGLDDQMAWEVGRATSLRYLIVTSPVLSDRGLEALGRLPKLESLYVSCPLVTDEAMEALQTARPRLHLHW